jgi:hypothetical protein
MNKLIKLPAIAAGTGAGLFLASLVVYYFNLDMKLVRFVVVPLLDKHYDSVPREHVL